jgi:hypothetical protein
MAQRPRVASPVGRRPGGAKDIGEHRLLESVSLCLRIAGYIAIDISGRAWPTTADVRDIARRAAAAGLGFDLTEDDAHAYLRSWPSQGGEEARVVLAGGGEPLRAVVLSQATLTMPSFCTPCTTDLSGPVLLGLFLAGQHVPRVGVDPLDPGDRALDPGLLGCLADRRLGDGLAEVDRAGRSARTVVAALIHASGGPRTGRGNRRIARVPR